MSYPAKTARNIEIVKKKDEEGMSFGQLSSYYNLAKSTLHQIYHRQKKIVKSKVR